MAEERRGDSREEERTAWTGASGKSATCALPTDPSRLLGWYTQSRAKADVVIIKLLLGFWSFTPVSTTYKGLLLLGDALSIDDTDPTSAPNKWGKSEARVRRPQLKISLPWRMVSGSLAGRSLALSGGGTVQCRHNTRSAALRNTPSLLLEKKGDGCATVRLCLCLPRRTRTLRAHAP